MTVLLLLWGPTSTLAFTLPKGTLARAIVWCGAGLLVLVALCPKLVALFVLIPPSVKAAMLLYVASFLMAQRFALTTVRLLDTRRTLIVGFGLTIGLVAALVPPVFLHTMPALASPLSIGAVTAFLVNLVTLPAVSRRVETSLVLQPTSGGDAADWFAAVAASSALKPDTARAVERSLDELANLLLARGVDRLVVAARRGEDRVEVALRWQGGALPHRAAAIRPDLMLGPDLMLDDAAHEQFVLWMATRETIDFSQRAAGDGREARLAFED